VVAISDVQYFVREGVDQQWCPIFRKGGSGLAVMSNILVGRVWTGCGVQYSGRDGCGPAVVSNIPERRKWTGSDVQNSGREGMDLQWCPVFWYGGSGPAVVSNILVGKVWTSSGVQYS
jgi:hypothetical protein